MRAGYGRGDDYDKNSKFYKKPWHEDSRKLGQRLGLIFPIGLLLSILYVITK